MTTPRSTQLVATSFVEQYYKILHCSPSNVFKFYKDESKLGRPEDDGTMTTTTTIAAIEDKLLLLNYENFRWTIKSVDAQESMNGGVTVLVTGSMTGYLSEKEILMNFTHSFFLARQDTGYYVLNDIFRYMDSTNIQEGNQVVAEDVQAPVTPEQAAQTLPVHEYNIPKLDNLLVEANGEVINHFVHNASVVEEEVSVVEEEMPVVEKEVPDIPEPEILHVEENGEVINHSVHDACVVEEELPDIPELEKVLVELNGEVIIHSIHDVSVVEEEVPNVEEEVPIVEEEVPVPKVIDEAQVASPVNPVVIESEVKLDDPPKKTFASLVMNLKQNPLPFSPPVPVIRKLPPKSKVQQANAVRQIPSAIDTRGSGLDMANRGSNQEEEAGGYSIYIKGLSVTATPVVLEKEFKKFGKIMKNGIQVRNNSTFTFGFVKYEAPEAVQKAIKASPITINGRDAYVEEKRSTARGNRERFSIGGDSGFHGGKGRGYYSGGIGYGQSQSGGDFSSGSRNKFASNRGGSLNNGGGSGRYQRVDSNGGQMNRGFDVNGTSKSMESRAPPAA